MLSKAGAYQSEFLAAHMISLETNPLSTPRMNEPVVSSSDFLGQHWLHKRSDPILRLIISQFHVLEDYGKKDPEYTS